MKPLLKTFCFILLILLSPLFVLGLVCLIPPSGLLASLLFVTSVIGPALAGVLASLYLHLSGLIEKRSLLFSILLYPVFSIFSYALIYFVAILFYHSYSLVEL